MIVRMGISISSKTKLKASLKLLNHINSFLFEQEYDELKYYTPSQRETIKNASRTLAEVIKNG